jgi:asparagine synthase (glutamine-hydrolysing)
MFLPRDCGRLLGSRAIGPLDPTGFDLEIAAWASSLDGDPAVSYSLFELTNYLRNTLLRDTDVMGMAHGLEIREPLLDHRLVERALTVPGTMQIAPRRNKPLLADATPEVPRATARRSKMGFTLPLDTWMRGPLRAWVLERLAESDILDMREIKRLWAAFERGHVSYSRIWTVVALSYWVRRHGASLATAR